MAEPISQGLYESYPNHSGHCSVRPLVGQCSYGSCPLDHSVLGHLSSHFRSDAVNARVRLLRQRFVASNQILRDQPPTFDSRVLHTHASGPLGTVPDPPSLKSQFESQLGVLKGYSLPQQSLNPIAQPECVLFHGRP